MDTSRPSPDGEPDRPNGVAVGHEHRTAFASLPSTGLPPTPRSTPAVAAIGEMVYLFGGATDDYRSGTVVLHDSVHSFDTTAARFALREPRERGPAPRAFAVGASDEQRGLFYVFGGASFAPGFADLTVYGDLWRYDPGANRWSQASLERAGPGPRVRANMWAFDGALWVFGGLDSSFTCHSDLWRFDLATDHWDRISEDQSGPVWPRHEAVSADATADGMAYVVGGETVAADFSAERTPGTLLVDLERGRVRPISIAPAFDLPGGTRNQGAAGAVGDAIYLIGGDDPSFEVRGCGAPYGQSPTGQVWRFEPGSATWTLVLESGPPLKRTAAATVGETIYLFCGWGFECADGHGPGQTWNTDVHHWRPSQPARSASPGANGGWS